MIQKELADIFQRNLTHQLGPMMISVTHVEMSPDLSVAKVYLSFIRENEAITGLDRVNRHKSEVRRELGRRVGKTVRIVPELAFFHDDSAGYASKMDKIINNLDIPPETEDSNSE